MSAPGGIPADRYDCKWSTAVNVAAGASVRGVTVASSSRDVPLPFAPSSTVASVLGTNGPSGSVMDVTSCLTTDTCHHFKVWSSNEGCDVITVTVGSFTGGPSHSTVLRSLPSVLVRTHVAVGAVVIGTCEYGLDGGCTGEMDGDVAKGGPPCDPSEGRLRLPYRKMSVTASTAVVPANPGANGT